MVSNEIYQCVVRYYKLNNEMSSNERIDNIKIIFGISRASFFRHFKEKNKKKLLCGKNKRNRKSKYTMDILNFIKRYLNRFKIINANKVILLIKNNFDVTISRSYFYVILMKIGFTYKKMYIKKTTIFKKKL